MEKILKTLTMPKVCTMMIVINIIATVIFAMDTNGKDYLWWLLTATMWLTNLVIFKWSEADRDIEVFAYNKWLMHRNNLYFRRLLWQAKYLEAERIMFYHE